MRWSPRTFAFALLAIVWIAGLSWGVWQLWKYDATPGAPAAAPPTWPVASRLQRNRNLPTLILASHPQCPCSRATMDELAHLMTTCQGKLDATVLMLRPPGVATGWEHTDLWQSAAAIPGVTVLPDEGGNEARRFGAMTSGQALLYAADGQLLFCGGITESRGHSGDNAGRSTICSLVLGQSGAPKEVYRTPVYGCPLFGECTASSQQGSPSCPQ